MATWESGKARKISALLSTAEVATGDQVARRSARAATRLMTSSNLLDWITGRSAGFAPLRMRPVADSVRSYPSWIAELTRKSPDGIDRRRYAYEHVGPG